MLKRGDICALSNYVRRRQRRGGMMFFKLKKINSMELDSYIDSQTRVEGTLSSEASICVAGHVAGSVNGKGRVEVEKEGVVLSGIEAQDIHIAGTVHGPVKADGELVISSTGQLHGDSSQRSLLIEEGGRFMGKSNMIQSVK
jgi:cytoskeletal protein CcmA (bactofilin family)